jgi:hypothetical protein
MPYDWSAPIPDEQAHRRAGARRRLNATRRDEAMARALAAEALKDDGLTTTQIAARLAIPARSVRRHLARMRQIRAVERAPLPASVAWTEPIDEVWLARIIAEAEPFPEDESAAVIAADGDDDEPDEELDAEARRLGLVGANGELDGVGLLRFLATDPAVPLNDRIAAFLALTDAGLATEGEWAVMRRIAASLQAQQATTRSDL